MIRISVRHQAKDVIASGLSHDNLWVLKSNESSCVFSEQSNSSGVSGLIWCTFDKPQSKFKSPHKGPVNNWHWWLALILLTMKCFEVVVLFCRLKSKTLDSVYLEHTDLHHLCCKEQPFPYALSCCNQQRLILRHGLCDSLTTRIQSQ